MNISKRFLLATVALGAAASILIAGGCGGGSLAAKEQTNPKYPEKPVSLIVAYGTGGGTDITARILGAFLAKELKQPVNVINVTGGSGWNGWGQLAQAKPDGYTIGYINIPNIFQGYLDPKAKRKETLDSFSVIMNHVSDPCLWVVKADSRYQTLQDLIDEVKKTPGKVSFAAHGVGGDDHLALMLMNRQAGTKFRLIHNNSTSISIAQLLGGHVEVVGANVSELFNLAKNGEVRVLGVMGGKRSEFIPDAPTFREQGFNIIMSVSRGIAAPHDMPPEVLKALTTALEQTVKNPEHVAKAREMGLTVDTMTGEQYKKFLKDEQQKIKQLMGW